MEDAASDEARVRRAFELALAREPDENEIAILEPYVERGDWATVARVLFNLDEFSHRN